MSVRINAGPLTLAVRIAVAAVLLGSSAAFAVPVTLLGTFDGTNGTSPDGALVYAGTKLLGTTSSGGANNNGTVFSLPTTGGTITTLASFDKDTTGSAPHSGLIRFGGGTLVAGTTSMGGIYSGGTIFSIPITGGTLTTMAAFAPPDGFRPSSPLLEAGNSLYGTTLTGGGATAAGSVFSIDENNGAPGTINTLATFDITNGNNPQSKVLYTGSSLVGTTPTGGANDLGTIFSVPLGGGAVTTLATFDGTNGRNPGTGLTRVGNKLYGTTKRGDSDLGTVFSIPLAGGPVTTLATFSHDNNGGTLPSGSLIVVGDKLYGTTQNGATENKGTIYSVPLAGGPATIVGTFGGSLGSSPTELTLAPGTNTLYGTTMGGGANGLGAVWSLSLGALVGDFDHNNFFNALDINLLAAATPGATPSPADALYDVNGDGKVVKTIGAADSDTDYLIHYVFHTEYGDAGLDGQVDFDDLLVLAQHYGNTTGGWAEGNFDGQNGVNFADLLLLAQHYGAGALTDGTNIGSSQFQSDWQLAVSLVPEPGSLGVVFVVAGVMSRRRRV